MQSFPQYLAAALVNGTLRKFSRLHADYLEQSLMSTTTDVSKNPTLSQPASGAPARVAVAKLTPAEQGDKRPSGHNVESQVTVGPVKQVGHQSFEGSNAGDHRPEAADAMLPNNPAPREPKGQ